MRTVAIQAFVQSIHVDRSYLIPEHRHPVFEMLYVCAGRSDVHVDGRTQRAGPGDLVIFQPGQTHREEVHRGPFHIVVLRFPANATHGVAVPGASELPTVLHLPWGQRFRAIAEAIAAEANSIDEWSPAMAEALLTEFTILLRRALAAPQPGRGGRPVWFDDALATLAASTSEERAPSLTQIARAQHGSPSTFRARFKAQQGVPPRRYALLSRLDRARDLLRETSLPITAVAHSLGFSSSQHLARQCRQILGLSPSEIRASIQR